MSARDKSPTQHHDRALSCVGIVLPPPDVLGGLSPTASSPWLVASGWSVTPPDGSIIVGTGAPEFVIGGTACAALHAGSIGSSVQAYDANLSALSAQLSPDTFIRATIAATGGTGGSANGTLTVQANRLDGTTPIASVRQILILAQSVQYSPRDVETGVTFSAATQGTIVASGGGWALVQTTSAGAFACTISDSADETVYFSATSPHSGQSSLTEWAVTQSDSASATWSA